jgi:hypothetical protein
MLAIKLHSFGKEGKLVFRILICKDGHEGLVKRHEKNKMFMTMEIKQILQCYVYVNSR